MRERITPRDTWTSRQPRPRLIRPGRVESLTAHDRCPRHLARHPCSRWPPTRQQPQICDPCINVATRIERGHRRTPPSVVRRAPSCPTVRPAKRGGRAATSPRFRCCAGLSYWLWWLNYLICVAVPEAGAWSGCAGAVSLRESSQSPCGTIVSLARPNSWSTGD